MRVLNQRSVSRVLVAASVVALMPVLARAQVVPPPPGPYQAMPQIPSAPGAAGAAASSGPAVPAMPGAVRPLTPPPSAAQIWGAPPVMQVPYWMQAPMPATQQVTHTQGGTSPNASPEPRGGGQAPKTQLSPAGHAAAPINSGQARTGQVNAPGYGAQLTPGYFPGYGAAQSAAGQAQMQAAAGAGQGGALATLPGQGAPRQGWSGYGAGYSPAYPGYGYGNGGYARAPGAYGYAPYPGQMALPYWGNWGMPAAQGYGGAPASLARQ